LKIVTNEKNLKKIPPPKAEEIKHSKEQSIERYKGQFPNTQKNNPLNATKASSQTLKKFLVCCFVIIEVPK